jgi:phosphoserine phosphatase
MPKSSRGASAASPLRLAAFDMDGVLIDHVSSWAAVHEALGTTNIEAVHAFDVGLIDDHEFILRDAAVWKRARPEFRASDLEDILARVPRMGGLRQAIDQLVARGVTCAIVSGGLRGLAMMLAREASFELVHANDVVFGPDGRLVMDSRVDVPLREKAAVVAGLQRKLGVSPAQTASVGDSAFDIGMFERSGWSVAFNPMEERVARAASFVVRGKDLRAVVAPLLEACEEAR